MKKKTLSITLTVNGQKHSLQVTPNHTLLKVLREQLELTGAKIDPLIDAFVEKGAIQCGFCTPGMILSAKYVLQQHPHPTLEQVQKGLEGNLCRCGGYRRIAEAVLAAAEVEDE